MSFATYINALVARSGFDVRTTEDFKAASDNMLAAIIARAQTDFADILSRTKTSTISIDLLTIYARSYGMDNFSGAALKTIRSQVSEAVASTTEVPESKRVNSSLAAKYGLSLPPSRVKSLLIGNYNWRMGEPALVAFTAMVEAVMSLFFRYIITYYGQNVDNLPVAQLPGKTWSRDDAMRALRSSQEWSAFFGTVATVYTPQVQEAVDQVQQPAKSNKRKAEGKSGGKAPRKAAKTSSGKAKPKAKTASSGKAKAKTASSGKAKAKAKAKTASSGKGKAASSKSKAKTASSGKAKAASSKSKAKATSSKAKAGKGKGKAASSKAKTGKGKGKTVSGKGEAASSE